jgi:hypothetical protein
MAIDTAAEKIMVLIGTDMSLHNKVIDILETYKATFMEKKETRKVAIVILLNNALEEKTVAIVPETCSVRFDGCNSCSVGDNGELACTKMACAEQQEPMCTVHEKIVVVADHTAECV